MSYNHSPQQPGNYEHVCIMCNIREGKTVKRKEKGKGGKTEREKDNIQRFVGVSLRWYVNS